MADDVQSQNNVAIEAEIRRVLNLGPGGTTSDDKTKTASVGSDALPMSAKANQQQQQQAGRQTGARKRNRQRKNRKFAAVFDDVKYQEKPPDNPGKPPNNPGKSGAVGKPSNDLGKPDAVEKLPNDSGISDSVERPTDDSGKLPGNSTGAEEPCSLKNIINPDISGVPVEVDQQSGTSTPTLVSSRTEGGAMMLLENEFSLLVLEGQNVEPDGACLPLESAKQRENGPDSRPSTGNESGAAVGRQQNDEQQPSSSAGSRSSENATFERRLRELEAEEIFSLKKVFFIDMVELVGPLAEGQEVLGLE